MPCFVPETFQSLGSGTNTVDSVPERVDGVGKLSLVELGLYFVEGIKEALGGDGWPHQQDAEDIPAEHVPPGGVGTLNAHVYGFRLQFFRDPGHPDERIDERRRDPQQVRDPVPLGPPAENLVELLLQAAKWHVQQEEQSGREEIDETEPEPGSVCVLELHLLDSIKLVSFGMPIIECKYRNKYLLGNSK